MTDLSDFHHCVCELLRHIRLEIPPPAADQDVISLLVEQRFTLHLGRLDAEHWFMHAALGMTLAETQGSQLFKALRANHMTQQLWHPVVALNADNQLYCWLRLPIKGCDLPTKMAAFDALIGYAEFLLQELATASSATKGGIARAYNVASRP